MCWVVLGIPGVVRGVVHGKGSVRGTLIGVLFLGVIVNGMTLQNVSEYWQYVVRGLLIIGAVLMNHALDREAKT